MRHHLPLRALCAVALLAGTLGLVASPALAQDSNRFVDLIEIDGVIDPPTAEYLEGRLETSQEDGAEVAIVQLDTPGGLEVSMREMVRSILESKVPIVVWVAPRGARAASAGTFITYAAHLAYMAEATELGAATPVNLSGNTVSRKATADAAAFIEELATLRDRDVEFAVSAVETAESIGATEAEERGVVDGIVSSPPQLLEAIDGQTVDVVGGSHTIETWDEATGAPSVRIRFQEMTLVQRLLHALTDPEVAFMLLLIGAFGLIFELYNPGIGLAGILGALALLMSFYALNVLPTNWAGVLLIVASVGFFVIDLQISGLGVWTIGGVIALVAGGLLLFAGAHDELTLSPWAIGAAVALTLVFFVSVMTAALRVRLRRPISGEEGMIGSEAVAKTDIAPEGTVVTKGTLWRARTMEIGIAAGSKVKVMATEGLVLLVEPLHESEPASPE